ncbi:hypothetical protein [Haloplanus salinus]|jgi:hypothetical protein|nr:hypothetical protein [Haloplanus salinus]
MKQRNHAAGRHSAPESKFYLPAGVPSSSLADRIEGLWATLFEHQIGPSE